MQIPLNSILIEDRGRKVFANIENLAYSIKRYGLLHPIVIAPLSSEECLEHKEMAWRLVAGERRILACQHLKLEEISATLRDDLTPILRKEIELEENLQREGMEWQEECLMIQSIHILNKQINRSSPEKWTLEKTADLLNRSKGGISIYLKIARAIEAGAEEIISCKTISGAIDRYDQLHEKALMKRKGELIKKQQEEDKSQQEDSEEDNSQQNKKSSNKEKIIVFDYEIIFGDCLEQVPYLADNSINLILTDPIWGVDIGDSARFDATKLHFSDTRKELLRLIKALSPQFFRILNEHAHCYVFCASDFFLIWKEHLEKAGFYVRPQPLIWMKEGGGFTNTKLNFMSCYEFILFATKGSRMLSSVQQDILQYNRPDQKDRKFSTQKPVKLLKRLIELSSAIGDIVLDPFCGSGSTIQACMITEREGLGIEIDEDTSKIARYLCDLVKLGI